MDAVTGLKKIFWTRHFGKRSRKGIYEIVFYSFDYIHLQALKMHKNWLWWQWTDAVTGWKRITPPQGHTVESNRWRPFHSIKHLLCVWGPLKTPYHPALKRIHSLSLSACVPHRVLSEMDMAVWNNSAARGGRWKSCWLKYFVSSGVTAVKVNFCICVLNSAFCWCATAVWPAFFVSRESRVKLALQTGRLRDNYRFKHNEVCKLGSQT